MSNWNPCLLGDVLKFQRGFDITKKQQSEGNIPIVSSSGVNSYHNEYKVSGPGVVIGRKGTLGTVHYMTENYWPHDTTLWIKDFKSNNPRFLYYFLKVMKLENLDAGSSNPTLNRNHLHKIKIKFPKLPLQKKIAAILATYDDLIEINIQRIQFLEKIGEEVYREWFVRFRFPEYLNQKFSKGIPKEWEIKPLYEIAELIKSKYKEEEHANLPLVDLEKINSWTLAVTEVGYPSELSTSRIIFEQNDILFSSIRPYLHKVIMAPFKGVTNTSILVIRPRIKYYRSFLTIKMFMKGTIDWAIQYSSGTKMPVISWNVLKKMKVLLPDKLLIEKFNEEFLGVLDEINILSEQNLLLKASRDSLLFRLFSNKLSIETLDIKFPPSMEEVNA